MMHRWLQWLGIGFVLLLCLQTTSAQESSTDADTLFDSDEILNIRMVAPFDTIARERSTEEYVPGQFFFTGGNSELIELDVGIRARGRYRRQPDVCSFPPLRLNFKKSQVKNTLFAGQDKVKLVTHCATGSYFNEQAIIAEFIAYKILNLLSDYSFRVRLLQIEYVTPNDDGGAGDSFDGYGVLIEHKNRLAERMGVTPLDLKTTSIASLDPVYLNLTSVFHYLIGNTDFSPISGSASEQCCHNQTLFGNSGESYYSIPYDFDMSGLVSAPYASPNPKLHLDSVQERLYRGRCINSEILPTTLEAFVANRDEIESIVRDRPELSSRKRREILNYIDQFYRSVAKPRGVDRNLIRKCKS